MEELKNELEELEEACEYCSSQRDWGTCDGCSIRAGIQQLENEINRN